MQNKLIVNLFTINKETKELTILKAPYKPNTVIKIDDSRIEELLKRYAYFKRAEKNNIIVFSQNLFDESNMFYATRLRYKDEFSNLY